MGQSGIGQEIFILYNSTTEIFKLKYRHIILIKIKIAV